MVRSGPLSTTELPKTRECRQKNNYLKHLTHQPQDLYIVVMVLLCSFLNSCSVLEVFEDYQHSNPLDQNNPQTRGNPYNLTIKSENAGNRLTWEVPGEEVFCQEYLLYRSHAGAKSIELVRLTPPNWLSSSFTWLDVSVDDGVKYAYFITCEGGEPMPSKTEPTFEAVLDTDGDGKRDKTDDDIDGDGVSNADET